MNDKLSNHAGVRSSDRARRRLRGLALAGWVSVCALGLACAVSAVPNAASAQISIGISVNIAPPPLPIYVQPPIPAPDYLWQPGYWAWDGDFNDYYWVPGTWVAAPTPGLLWTPGYWGWGNGGYYFHEGYWGPHVGYYGGVFYGFGFTGHGYEGGYWSNNHVFYNRSVNNIGSVNITNVYNKTVIINPPSRASFNGPGGVSARPSPQDIAAQGERHVPPTAAQLQNAHAAAAEPSLRAASNHGAPPVAATARPGEFHAGGVVAAHAGVNPTQPHGPAAGRPEASRPGQEPQGAEPAKPARPVGVGEPRPAAQSARPMNEAAPRPHRPPAPDREAAPRHESQPRVAAPPRPHPDAPRPHPAAPRPAGHPEEHKDEPKR